ncbi:MAG: PAS domain-containing sensor histidine kinase, partial [Halobacteria archaeon]|nr:PAS domain-containing sensor histidine kinase [Halobacteria archaeon]
FVKDREGKYLLVNESLADAYGTTPDEVEGEMGTEFLKQEEVEQFRKDDIEVIESGEPKHIPEEKITYADGTEHLLETKKIPFEPAHTEKDAVLGVATDITERKQRERELERKNERLEEFASIVSHDLRNPLSVAKGRLDLVEEEYENGSRHLDEMRNAHNRIEQLIDDLLTLARQGDTVEEMDEVNLSEVVKDCWTNVRTDGVELEVGDSLDREIRADPGRLRQILENLFRNSVEHASTSNSTGSNDGVEHGKEDDGIRL